jgi:hypothetical protein
MYIVTVLLLLGYACGAAAAEDDPAIPAVSYPALAGHAGSAEDFGPPGWPLESKVSGDLNGDGRDDLVLVLRGNDPRNLIDARERGGPQSFDTNPRILAVALANAGAATIWRWKITH